MPLSERPADWLEAFGPGARTAVALAQDAAQAFGHNYLGSEHLLIGLAEVEGPARDELASDVSAAGARMAVEGIVGRGRPRSTEAPGLTPRARQSLQRAYDVARGSGSATVEPTHLLIALTELDSDAVASAVFRAAGVDRKQLRHRLMQLLEDGPAT